MNTAINSIRHTALFGLSSVLMLANGPAQGTTASTLFAVGELGGTGLLCSLIVRQYRRRSMTDRVMSAVAGYSISHMGILTVMFLGLFGTAAPGASGRSTLLWMELTLRVGLVVVLTAAAFVLLKPVIRKVSVPRLRKSTATA